MIYYLAMSTQGNQSASGQGQSHQTQSQETAMVTSVSDTQAVSNASVTTVTATSGSTVMSQPLESTGGANTEVTSAHLMQQGMATQWQPYVLPPDYFSGQAPYILPPVVQGWHQPMYVLPPVLSQGVPQQPHFLQLPFHQGVSAPGVGLTQQSLVSQAPTDTKPVVQSQQPSTSAGAGVAPSSLVVNGQNVLPMSQRQGPSRGPLPPPPPEDRGRRPSRPAPSTSGGDKGAKDIQLPPGLAAFMAATTDDKYFQSVNYSKAVTYVKPFDGLSPLREFVELIDDLKQNFQLDNKAAGSLARASLEGEAQRYIRSLMPYEFPNRHLWRDQPASGTHGSPEYVPAVEGSLSSALWSRFGERISPAETKRAFDLSIPQRPKESFAAYVDRLKYTCRRYIEATYGKHGSNLAARDPSVYATMFNSEMMNAMWSGMLLPYRDHLEVFRYSFVWFDQITTSAVEFELTEKGRRLLNLERNGPVDQGHNKFGSWAAEVDAAQSGKAPSPRPFF